MSIHYTLYHETTAKHAEVPKALRPVIEVHEGATGAEVSAGTSWLSDGPISMTAKQLDWLPGIAERNEVAAKLCVDFQLIAEEVTEAKPTMLRHVLALLDHFEGNAVLHDVADNVVLRRRAEKLEINTGCSFWTPELLGLVAQAHTTYEEKV
jgi:hypothetical protein